MIHIHFACPVAFWSLGLESAARANRAQPPAVEAWYDTLLLTRTVVKRVQQHRQHRPRQLVHTLAQVSIVGEVRARSIDASLQQLEADLLAWQSQHAHPQELEQ